VTSSVAAPTPLDLGAVLRDPAVKVLVTCGSGGVGKTTTAAALALAAAEAGRTVAVLTIDPARRLAQSLGLQQLDNEPRRVQLDEEVAGELWAMMLDSRRTFDEMVSAHASPARAEQIFANPFYKTISTNFSGTQEYMAMEKLSQLAAAGDYDLVVVDTPPSRSALDFLDAPQRLGSFLDGRMIRLLSTPGRGVMRIVGAGFTLFTRAVTAVIGGQMLADAGAFVQLFESMFGGFRERAQATYDLLRGPGAMFVVVAAPEPDAVREASYFADRLLAERMPLAGLVLNRTHPPLADLDAAATSAALADLGSAAPLAAAALQVHERLLTQRAQEVRLRNRFVRAHPELPVVEVPALPFDAHDLPQLQEIGRRLLTGRRDAGPAPA
jgi:anion-transporting  ArsA/GET3 family ATPase